MNSHSTHRAFTISLRTLVIIALCTWLLLPTRSDAQSAVERFFTEMPDNVLPVLPQKARAELVLLARGGAEPVVENLFANPARLTLRNDNYLRIAPTATSRFEVRMLPTDSAPLFCVIYTLPHPIPYSRISFYTADGREVQGYFEMPDLRAFLTAPDSTAYLVRKYWAERLVPFHVEAHFEEAEDILCIEVRTNRLSLEELQGTVGAFRPVRLRWRGGKWETADNSPTE